MLWALDEFWQVIEQRTRRAQLAQSSRASHRFRIIDLDRTLSNDLHAPFVHDQGPDSRRLPKRGGFGFFGRLAVVDPVYQSVHMEM